MDTKEDSSSLPVAFVGGATGYTGQAVVAALRARGVPTVAHIRPGSAQLETCRAAFQALGATVSTAEWTEDAIKTALSDAGAGLVFALLGTTKARMAQERRRGEAGLGYGAVDWGMTKMLIDGAWALQAPARVVYLSALGVRAAKPGQYYHARWKVEQALQAGGGPFTIARPSFITGTDRQERRPAERIGARLADGLLCLAGAKARAKFASMDAATLGRALVDAALDPAALGAILEPPALRVRGAA